MSSQARAPDWSSLTSCTPAGRAAWSTTTPVISNQSRTNLPPASALCTWGLGAASTHVSACTGPGRNDTSSQGLGGASTHVSASAEPGDNGSFSQGEAAANQPLSPVSQHAFHHAQEASAFLCVPQHGVAVLDGGASDEVGCLPEHGPHPSLHLCIWFQSSGSRGEGNFAGQLSHPSLHLCIWFQSQGLRVKG